MKRLIVLLLTTLSACGQPGVIDQPNPWAKLEADQAKARRQWLEDTKDAASVAKNVPRCDDLCMIDLKYQIEMGRISSPSSSSRTYSVNIPTMTYARPMLGRAGTWYLDRTTVTIK